jgi:hypothetical protein
MKLQDIQAVETSPAVRRRSGYLTEYPEAVNLRRTAELREAEAGGAWLIHPVSPAGMPQQPILLVTPLQD